MSVSCYFLYGPKGTGKTLTAYLLSDYYNSFFGLPFQPFTKTKNMFNFKGYRGEEVILIDNDLYKGREYAIYLMITNWYQVSPIQRSGYRRCGYEHERYEEHWKPPRCIVICSREKPTTEMLKCLKETKSHILQYKYNNFQNILDDIKEKFPEMEKNIEDLRKEKTNVSETESDSEVLQELHNENEKNEEKKPRKSKKKENFKGNIFDYIKLKNTPKK